MPIGIKRKQKVWCYLPINCWKYCK